LFITNVAGNNRNGGALRRDGRSDGVQTGVSENQTNMNKMKEEPWIAQNRMIEEDSFSCPTITVGENGKDVPSQHPNQSAI
jgi:hypothetical protein